MSAEKKMTNYDLKKQRKAEAATKAKKEDKRDKLIGMAVAVVLLGWVLSFPIRGILAQSQTLFTVNGEAINRIEYDYNYMNVKATFINENGSYLSYYGISDINSMDKEMYSEDKTFGQYFAELTAENIKKTKALEAAAKAEGFEMDLDTVYESVEADVEAKAKESGLTVRRYLKSNYGKYATWARLEDIVKENLYVEAFYVSKADSLMPSEEAITAHYEANKAEYDSVDYYITTITADIPTTTTDEEGKEVSYTATEEEIQAAMDVARKEADVAKGKVTTEGELKTNVRRNMVYDLLEDFLYGDTTEVGDVFVAEDGINHKYYVVSLADRYLDQSPTADIRAIVSKTYGPDQILSGWDSGEQTEERFIKIGNIYDENGMKDSQFRYNNLTKSDLDEQMGAWVFDESRKAGDIGTFTNETGYNYVTYFRSFTDPIWKLSVQNTLLESALSEYLTGLVNGVNLEDPKGMFN